MNVLTVLQLFISFPSFISSKILLKTKSCLHPKINLAENNSRDLHKKPLNNKVWKQLTSIRKLKRSINFDHYSPYYHLTTALKRFGFWDQDKVWPHSRDNTLQKPRCKISFIWKNSQRTPKEKFPVTLEKHCNLYFHKYLKSWLGNLNMSDPRGQIWPSFAQEKSLHCSSDASQQSLGVMSMTGHRQFPLQPKQVHLGPGTTNGIKLADWQRSFDSLLNCQYGFRHQSSNKPAAHCLFFYFHFASRIKTWSCFYFLSKHRTDHECLCFVSQATPLKPGR